MRPETVRESERKRCREAMRRLRARRRDERLEKELRAKARERSVAEGLNAMVQTLKGVLSIFSGMRNPVEVDGLLLEAEKRGRALSIPTGLPPPVMQK